MERATVIYDTVLSIFDYQKANDCVTPMEVVRKQFQHVEKTGKIIIPGAGIGSYVLGALEHGFAPEDITAVELSPHYFALGEAIFTRFGVNYVQADFLEWNPPAPVDVVIGNPPFSEGGKTLWRRFLKKAFQLLTPAGQFSFVAPAKAAVFGSQGYNFFKKINLEAVEYGADSWFGKGEPVALFSGSVGEVTTDDYCVIAGNDTVTVKRGSVLPVQYMLPTRKLPTLSARLTLSILTKFFQSKTSLLKERYQFLSEPPTVPYVYLALVPWGSPYAYLAKVGEHDNYLNGYFMTFDTLEQAHNMQWLLSGSLVYRFVVASITRSGWLSPVLRYNALDWFGVTTDEELFDRLELTPEEVSYLKQWGLSLIQSH